MSPIALVAVVSAGVIAALLGGIARRKRRVLLETYVGVGFVLVAGMAGYLDSGTRGAILAPLCVVPLIIGWRRGNRPKQR